MRGADLVITKAGGITLFEILHSQVPLFVIHPFLEQEMNNARYAAEKGFAKVIWGRRDSYIPIFMCCTSFSYVLLRLNRRLQTESTAPEIPKSCTLIIFLLFSV